MTRLPVPGAQPAAAPTSGKPARSEPISTIVGGRSTPILILTISALVVAAVLALVMPSRTVVPGLPDPGVVTTVGLPVARVLFHLSAALAVGWLFAAAFWVGSKRDGTVDISGFRALRGASTAAWCWLGSCGLVLLFTVSDTRGRPVWQTWKADSVLGAVQALEPASAPLWAALAAVIVAVCARLLLKPGGAVLLIAVCLAGLAPMAVAGHASQPIDHDIASNAMIAHYAAMDIWVGGLVAVLVLLRHRVAYPDIVVRRYSSVALWCFVLIAASGYGNAVTRMTEFGQLFSTSYGHLLMAKIVATCLIGVIGYLHRRRTIPAIAAGAPGALWRLGLGEVAVMGATMGIAVALGRTAPPPPSGTVPSDVALIVGFDLDGPLTLDRVFTAWRFDTLLGTASLVAIALYLLGVQRLHAAGTAWKRSRTIAWVCGCATIIFATSTGIGRYAQAQFSIHMVSHMILGMLAPVLLVLGAPITMLLRNLPSAGRGRPSGLRELVVRLVHSPISRFVTNPFFVLFLFVGSFYAVYFTGLFDWFATDHLGHLVMNLHFLLVGYLYYWVIIGNDPAPRQLSYLVKLGVLFAAMPFHAFFGVTLMNGKAIRGENYYRSLDLPWVHDLLADQHIGGGIAWGGGEFPLLIVVIALMTQWANNDERRSRHADARQRNREDAELAEYNKMLAELNRTDP